MVAAQPRVGGEEDGPRPGSAAAPAFEGEERELVHRVGQAECPIELEAVDDHGPAIEVDVLGTQVTVALDDPPVDDALLQQPRSLSDERALSRDDPLGAGDVIHTT